MGDSMKAIALFALFTLSLVAAMDPRDLHRAQTKIPRAPFKGETPQKMSHALNGHLTRSFPNTKPCEDWTAEELQVYQAELYHYRETHFDDIYQNTSDNRRMRHMSLEAHKQEWKQLNALVQRNPRLAKMHRDGHCHEAVMWLVHHVPASEQQTVFATQRFAPPLPVSGQHDSCDATATASELKVCKAYEGMRSCADCHSGTGIPMQDYSDPDGYIPEDPKHPGWARQRRCDQNYIPACGPCDGIGGPYWGDKVADFQPTNCEVVALPSQVPEAERLAPQFAQQYIVHQLGSDRLARTQNAAKFAFYSQIRSTLWYDFPLSNGSGTADDGIAKLRHDTFYDDLAYKWMDDGLVTEVHLQTAAQREANVTGPMVSLMHGLLGYGKYMGGLTCLADPVGVPVLASRVSVNGTAHSAFLDGADYKGRIKIGVEYDGFKMGDKGNGDMKKKRNMTVDHYAKWFLHVFVDADKTSPTFGQPVRFYGPYSGFAVYVKFEKKQPPAEVWEQICPDNGWGESESKPIHPCKGETILDSKDQIMIVEKKHPEVCSPYVNGTLENLQPSSGEVIKGSFGTIFAPKETASTLVV